MTMYTHEQGSDVDLCQLLRSYNKELTSHLTQFQTYFMLAIKLKPFTRSSATDGYKKYTLIFIACLLLHPGNQTYEKCNAPGIINRIY